MKYLSLFSGIGGFELGINQAHEIFNLGRSTSTSDTTNRRNKSLLDDSNGNGWWSDPMCVGFSEIDKYAIQIYQKHFPNHKNYGDITKIKAEDLPEFDLIVGGFPCQSFSIAGKRGGFADTRGTLFFDIARIIKTKQPRLLLLENVKGLLSHDKGDTFRTIIATLDELGYDIQWQVLNSKNFGVPQNRERVFIVGHLRGTPRPKVFPIDGPGHQIAEAKKTGVIPVLSPDRIEKRQNGRRFKEDGDVAFTLTSQDRHGILQINQPKHSNERVYAPEGISPTLNTMQGGGRQPFILQRGRGKNRGGPHTIAPTLSSHAYQENNHLVLSKTVRAGGRESPHGSKQNWDSYEFQGKIRRLTPLECERLQAYPDGWTEGISDTQRYKTLGNGVTTKVVQAVMERLLDFS